MSNNMSNSRLLLIVNILMTPTLSFALTTHDVLPFCNTATPCHPVITGGMGAARVGDTGQSRSYSIVNPISDEFYIYSANHSSQTDLMFDGFIGEEWNFRPDWALQFGLGYNQVANIRAEGSLYQGADAPSANNYSYHYNITTRQLLAESKLLYQFRERYHPYLLLGLGVAINEASDYNTSAPKFQTFTRVYANNTETSFTYSVGFGLDVDIMQHLRIGVGYRFVDFGQAALGGASIDTTNVNGTFSKNHLYANELLAQFTYVS